MHYRSRKLPFQAGLCRIVVSSYLKLVARSTWATEFEDIFVSHGRSSICLRTRYSRRQLVNEMKGTNSNKTAFGDVPNMLRELVDRYYFQ